MLRLVTFGGLTLVRDGVLHTGPASQRRRLALLALLAVAGKRGMSRDKLLGYLWPESQPEGARHSLHQSLHALRRSLEVEALFLGTAALQLNPELISSDVADFEDALERRDHERAVSLYGGPFLDGFYLEGVVEFEQWVDAERARRAREYGVSLDALVTSAAQRKDYVTAAQWGRRLAAAEPLNSRAAIRLIEALVAAGDRAGALQFARVHEVLVREELDTQPDAVIVEWMTRLRAGQGTGAAQAVSPGPGSATPGTSGRTATGAGRRQIERLARALGDRYQVGQKGAEGAVIRTYAARATREGVPVELHVVQPRLAATASTEVFLRAIGRAAALSHPHIVPIYEYGAIEDVLFFVTTPAEGTTLRERLIREQQLPLEEVLRVGHAIAAALAHAHEQEVWHGDLRPKHVRLPQGRVLVESLGLVDALAGEEGSGGDTTVVVFGGPAYQSPEVLSGGKRPDARTDLYSLGCVLYAMLTGEPPFGRATHPGALGRRLTEPPPSVRVQRETAPESLERLVGRCLARVPADRPSSAAEVSEQLAALAGTG